MPTLSWLTRDTDIHVARHVPFRLLEESPNVSTDDTGSGNVLIQGDSLEALKALLPFYAGQVKCVYPRLFMEHVDKGFQPGVFVRSEPGFS